MVEAHMIELHILLPIDVPYSTHPRLDIKGDTLSLFDAQGGRLAIYDRDSDPEELVLTHQDGKWVIVFHTGEELPAATWHYVAYHQDDSVLLDTRGELHVEDNAD
jgi:hypothetical protein